MNCRNYYTEAYKALLDIMRCEKIGVLESPIGINVIQSEPQPDIRPYRGQ